MNLVQRTTRQPSLVCTQVSAGALSELLTATGEASNDGATARAAAATNHTGADGASTSGADTHAPLTVEGVREVRRAALARVSVPPAIVNLLVDLRTYMQEQLEPPAYISDRRMVKAVQLLQARRRASPTTPPHRPLLL
jgi:MoxR-like ATPase